MNKEVFVGVDGCRAGWFAVFLAVGHDQNCEWEIGLFPSFSSLIDFLDNILISWIIITDRLIPLS